MVLPSPDCLGHRITSSCQSEEQEAGMRNQFPSFPLKEKNLPCKAFPGVSVPKKKKKAVAWQAYPFLAYSFGSGFTALYNLIILLISLERCFRYIQVAFGWNHICHKAVRSYLASEYRRRICFTDIPEFLHGQLAGFVFWNISERLQENTQINSIKWWQDFWFTGSAGLNFRKNI